MTEENTSTPTRPERTFLNWLIFGLALVALVVFLIVIAMDRDNIDWENGKPWCPHCRLEVPAYSTKCPTCRERYDWITDERLCYLCLADSDVDWIHSIPADEMDVTIRKAFSADASQTKAVMEWLQKIDSGDCVHCAGTGIDLFAPVAENGAKTPCPVCFGDGDCILCEGREKIRIGNLDAHRDYMRHMESLAYHDGRLARPTAEKLQEAVESIVGTLQGYHEVSLIKGVDGTTLVNLAAGTRRRILGYLPQKPEE
jgi:hypothetical protein